MAKIGVVLFNLGGPANLAGVEKFLFNLFYDKAIINLPNPFRFFLAKLISKTRKNKSSKIYEKMGGASPILKQTNLQAQALQKILGSDFKVYVCMRYSEPSSKKIADEIINDKVSEVIFLPLYPQFSTTTSESSFDDLEKHLPKKLLIKKVGCYFAHEKFISAHVELIEQKLLKAKDPLIIFSAHSLPQKIIDAGDPYQWQVEKTVENIMKNFNQVKHILSYQSKVGPLKWLQPATEDEIKKAALANKDVIVVPIAFVSEHSETLVELDVDYKELFEQNTSTAKYIRVPALQQSSLFIQSLAEICNLFAKKEESESFCSSFLLKKLCLNKFKRCICNDRY